MQAGSDQAKAAAKSLIDCVGDRAGKAFAERLELAPDGGLSFSGTEAPTEEQMAAVTACGEGVAGSLGFGADALAGMFGTGTGQPGILPGGSPASGIDIDAIKKCLVAAGAPGLAEALSAGPGGINFGAGFDPSKMSQQQMLAMAGCLQQSSGAPGGGPGAGIPTPPFGGALPQLPSPQATPRLTQPGVPTPPSAGPTVKAPLNSFQQCAAGFLGADIAALFDLVAGQITVSKGVDPASVPPQVTGILFMCAQQSVPSASQPGSPAAQPTAPSGFPPQPTPPFGSPPGFPTAGQQPPPPADPRQAEFTACVTRIVGAQAAAAISITNGSLTFGAGLNPTALTPQNLEAIQACGAASGLLAGPGQASSPEEKAFKDCLKATHLDLRSEAIRLTAGGLPDLSITGEKPMTVNELQIVVDCVPGLGSEIRAYRLSAENRKKVLDAAAIANRSVVMVETNLGGAGSGFFISKSGLIMTNNHVVAGASSFTIWLHDGRKFPATLVGSVPIPDIAVLRIDNPPGDIVPLPVGKSGTLARGQTLLAVGHPGGYGNWLATAGRFIELKATQMQAVKSLDPTETLHDVVNLLSVVPGASGNSGGPILDLDGKVVGVVYGGSQRQHIKSDGAPVVAPFKIREYSVVAQIGQAVPIETALHLAADFTKDETLRPSARAAGSNFTPVVDAPARSCMAAVVGQQLADAFKVTRGGLPDFSGFGSKSLTGQQFVAVIDCVPGLMLIPSPEVMVVEDFPPAFSAAVRAQAEAAAKKVESAVVFLDANREGTATGFIISSDGLILTNNHNVEKSGGQGLVVWTKDGRKFPATLVASVKQPDVALLKISAPSGLQPVTIGASTGLKADQPLVVVGNPGGLGNWVSTLGKFVKFYEALDLQGKPVSEFQATTPTHQGNSGSPVVDLDGKVVGLLWGGGDPDGTTRQPGERPVPSSPGVLEYLKVDDHLKAVAIEEAMKLVRQWTGG